MTEKTPTGYYKLDIGKNKIYWFENKPIGNVLATVKYLMNKKGISSVKAHKIISKLKEAKEDK